jgi:hypothetical protein
MTGIDTLVPPAAGGLLRRMIVLARLREPIGRNETPTSHADSRPGTQLAGRAARFPRRARH